MVLPELPAIAQLLGDSKENFVILILDQRFKVRDELLFCFAGANGEDDSFQAVDCVDLQVDLLGLHLLFQEG